MLEIFGGKAGCTKVATQRRLKTGQNQDLCAGIDLTNPRHQQLLWKLIREKRPRVIIMAPPCTAFGPWSRYNRHVNPRGYRLTLRTGVMLANLAADIALFQLDHDADFICENPQSSDLWQLSAWQLVLRHPRVCFTHCHQCAFGLRDPSGLFYYKPTKFVSSNWILIKRLERRCDGRHEHQVIEGSVHGQRRSRLAQTWPRKLCSAIVDGIIELFQQKLGQHTSRTSTSYPTAEAGTGTHVDEEPKARGRKRRDEKCAACQAGLPESDPSHSRMPYSCKFLPCKACRNNKDRHHPSHLRGDQCKFPYD